MQKNYGHSWRNNRWMASAVILGGLFAAFLLAQRKLTSAPTHPPASAPIASVAIQLQPKSYPFTFAAYGDIRFTDRGSHMYSDPVRRLALLRKIGEDKPDFLVISGDLVLDGGNAADWKIFDQEIRPLPDTGIKIFPVLGNHDVRGGESALDNYFQRFPQFQHQRWYSLRYGNCLFLMLDSDSDHTPGTPQGDWLIHQLDHVPGDVDFIFLAMHHPPYTHSSDSMAGGGHSARSQEQRLATLLEQRQATLRAKIIAIAGHVHNYERYEHGGVTYIVAGGGGATPYMIQREASDVYRQPGPTYHYCTFTIDHGRLKFAMHKLDMENGQPKFTVADSFELAVK